MAARIKLSDEQLERMAEKRERGLSHAAIARIFTAQGTPVLGKSIAWQCLRLGVVPLGEQRRGGRPSSFTAAEDARVLFLAGQGLSGREIARRMGRTHGAVLTRLRRLYMREDRIAA